MDGILVLEMVLCTVCVCVSSALIKRFLKDCFWGRLDYLIIGSYAANYLYSFQKFFSRVRYTWGGHGFKTHLQGRLMSI